MGDLGSGLQHDAGGLVSEHHRVFPGAMHLMQLRVTDPRGELFHDDLSGPRVRQCQRFQTQGRGVLRQHHNVRLSPHMFPPDFVFSP